MTLNERRDLYSWNLTPDTQLCINCKYFYRHYREDGWAFDSGHCVYPRLKLRKAYDSCNYFQNKKPPCVHETQEGQTP